MIRARVSVCARARWSLGLLASLSAGLASSACTDEVGTSVRISLVYKDSWKMSSADVVTSQAELKLERNARIAHEILVLVPDTLAGTVMPFDVWGVRDGERIAHGSAVALPRKGETVGATIVLDRLPCGVFCTPGDLQCEANGLSTCVEDADGCLQWGAPTSCPAAMPYCSSGVCGQTCSDECVAAESECVDAKTQRQCGEYDSDLCLDFGPKVECAATQVCYAGRCAPPCTLGALDNAAVPDSAGPFGPRVVIDAKGTAHAVYSAMTTRQLRYATRSTEGVWSAWEAVPGGIGENPALAVDKQGNVHLAFGGAALVYGVRSAGSGTWQLTPLETGAGIADSSSIALDSDGVVHIVYDTAAQVLRHARQGTPWMLEDVKADIGPRCDLAVTGTTLHVSSFSKTNDLWYSTLSPGGTWTSSMIQDLTSDVLGAAARTSIAVDRTGTLHLIYSDLLPGYDDLRYLYKSGASWTTNPVIVDDRDTATGAYPDLAIDPFDRLHVAYRTTAASPKLQYASRDSGSGSAWVIDRQPAATTGLQPSIATAPSGGVLIVSRGAALTETSRRCQ